MEEINNPIRVKAIYPEMLSEIFVPKAIKRLRFYENKYVCKLCKDYKNIYKSIYTSINSIQITNAIMTDYERNKSGKFSYDNLKKRYKILFKKIKEITEKNESIKQSYKLSDAIYKYFNLLYQILLHKKTILYISNKSKSTKTDMFIDDKIDDSDKTIWEEVEMYEINDEEEEENEEENFDKIVPTNLICDICQKLFKKPIVTLCCDHNFCEKCIINVLTRECPNCGEKISALDIVEDATMTMNVKKINDENIINFSY